MPSNPTIALLQGCTAAHSIASWKSRNSAGEFTSSLPGDLPAPRESRSEEHTSELQSQSNLVCRLLLEKKKINRTAQIDADPLVEQDRHADGLLGQLGQACAPSARLPRPHTEDQPVTAYATFDRRTAVETML